MEKDTKRAQGKRLRAAIYCRISQTDGRVDKVDIQQRECTRYAKRKGYDVELVYVDDGISAYTGRARPDYLQMLRDAEAQRFDVIVATFEDRLSRRPAEKVHLAEICREAGIIWDTVNEGVSDPKDPDDELMSYFRGYMGQREQTLKIERLRARFAERRADGKPLWGVRPFGFELDRIEHRPDEAAEVQWACEHILNGGSVYGIVKRWNETGILTSRKGTWSNQSVRQVLRRPRNAGLMEEHGVILWDQKAVWDPLVDRATWEEVCAILSSPTRSTVDSREPRWLCAGLVRCGVCGDVMRSASGSDRKGRFKIYRCTRKARTAITDSRRHTAVKTADLDVLVREAIVSAFLLAPTSWLPNAAPDVAEARRIEKRLRALRLEQVEVTSLVGEPGASVRVIKEKLSVLHNEEEELIAERDECHRRSVHARMLAGSAESLFATKTVSFSAAADRMREVEASFDALSLADKRALVRSLLRVTVYPGRTLERIEVERLWERGQQGFVG